MSTRRGFLSRLFAIPAAGLTATGTLPNLGGADRVPTVRLTVPGGPRQPAGEWETRLRYSIDTGGNVYLREYEVSNTNRKVWHSSGGPASYIGDVSGPFQIDRKKRA